MDNIEGIKDILKERLSPKRYDHTLGVAQEAAKLAEMYGADSKSAYLAGLAHDYAKCLSGEALLAIAEEQRLITDGVERLTPSILHGTVGAFLLRQEGLLDDEALLQAIACHTTGRAEMSLMDKILYIADYIEPGRSFPGVEALREAAYNDLDAGVLAGINHTLAFLLESGAFIHPSSIACRNAMLEKMKIKNRT